MRKGYVIWRRGKPVGHILTVLKSMEDLSASKLSPRSSSANPSLKMDEIEIPAFLRRQAD